MVNISANSKFFEKRTDFNKNTLCRTILKKRSQYGISCYPSFHAPEVSVLISNDGDEAVQDQFIIHANESVTGKMYKDPLNFGSFVNVASNF